MPFDPPRSGKDRRSDEQQLRDWSEAAVTDAILLTFRRWGIKTLAVVLLTLVGSIVGAKLWAAGVQEDATAARVAATALTPRVALNERRLNRIEQVQTDMMLLQCAKRGLNDTEKAICRKYEPLMPEPR